MAVVAPVELDDRVTRGHSARQTNRAHRRLGPTRDEAQHLDVRHARDNQPRELQLELRGDTEARPVLHHPLERIENRGRSVAENERTPREDVVDVFVAVDIPDPRASAFGDEERLAANPAKCTNGRAHATGKELRRSPQQVVRPRRCSWSHWSASPERPFTSLRVNSSDEEVTGRSFRWIRPRQAVTS